MNEFIEQLAELSQQTPHVQQEADEQKEVMNPWSAKVAKAQFESYLQGNTLSHSILILSSYYFQKLTTNEYVVLEDLTGDFKNPCICDIKMGTRQHGDDAAPDKKVRHQKKVLTTTSLPLGIRMCGIQVNYTYNYKTNVK
jgi:hypothetical protein